ncbi:zinc-dependent alcohol dehydrogenase family protein [Novosphingobium sp.]|uniref:zinc-dependent alcohol dehydrogenase family protein n=1 Tax=Novosphingobium sp. TaxID=1874826 RepID=UPI003BA84D0B
MLSRHYALSQDGSSLSLAQATKTVPDLAPNSILIKIRAASLNYRDLLTMGDAGGTRDGLTPLSDAAGEVIAIGSSVTRWKIGDRVSPNFFPAWLGGAFSPVHLSNALGGGQTDGVLCEYLVIDQAAAVAIPDHLSFVEAATLPCAGVTAWHALFERGKLTAGETVLVQGTGGVALFGLQLAAAQGARVIVTSSSDAKLERAAALGAWKTINYKNQPDWDQAAMALTGGHGVDHILELGGPDTYDRSIAAIAPGGKIAQIGVLSGFGAQPNLTPLQFKNASINGICVGSVEHYARLNAFIAEHAIHPIVDQVFAFDEAPLAYEQLRGAGHFGKIAITFDR